jgi:hypothetical protein
MFVVGVVILTPNLTHKGSITSAKSVSGVLSFNGTSVPVQDYTYSGKYNGWVRKLLTRVGGWQCPADDGDSGTPPKVKSDECMRDKYVAAAVLYAWAAECYARREETSKAEAAAEQMYQQLKNAQSLCSNAPSFGTPRDCDTERIFRCGEL